MLYQVLCHTTQLSILHLKGYFFRWDTGRYNTNYKYFKFVQKINHHTKWQSFEPKTKGAKAKLAKMSGFLFYLDTNMGQLTFQCAGCLGYLNVKTTFELLGIGGLLTSSRIGLFDKAPTLPLQLTYCSPFIYIFTERSHLREFSLIFLELMARMRLWPLHNCCWEAMTNIQLLVWGMTIIKLLVWYYDHYTVASVMLLPLHLIVWGFEHYSITSLRLWPV